MRLRVLLACVALAVATSSTTALATVLLPSDDSASPSLGLVPRANTQKAPAKEAPQAQEQPAQVVRPSAPAPAANAPTPTAPATSSVDAVNTRAIQSVDIDTLRSSMPSEFKNLSDDDIKKLVAEQTEQSRAELINKYLKTDPKTGQSYVDFDQLTKDKAAKQTQQSFTPGGTVAAPKALTIRDKKAASMMAKGDIAGAIQHSKPVSRKLPFMKKPPTIITSKDLPFYDNVTLKNRMNVSVPKEFSWGQKDVQTVGDILGYTEQTIPQNCQIRLDTSVLTDDGKNLYNATIFSGNAQKIGYNGTIKTVKARPYAVCNKPEGTLPDSGRILFAYGEKYAVMLQEATCPVSAVNTQSGARPPSSLVMQYVGDSKVTCTFVK